MDKASTSLTESEQYICDDLWRRGFANAYFLIDRLDNRVVELQQIINRVIQLHDNRVVSSLKGSVYLSDLKAVIEGNPLPPLGTPSDKFSTEEVWLCDFCDLKWPKRHKLCTDEEGWTFNEIASMCPACHDMLKEKVVEAKKVIEGDKKLRDNEPQVCDPPRRSCNDVGGCGEAGCFVCFRMR